VVGRWQYDDEFVFPPTANENARVKAVAQGLRSRAQDGESGLNPVLAAKFVQAENAKAEQSKAVP
jgi:hypothetical protein